MQHLQVNQGQEFAVFIGGIPKACKREYIYNELKKLCYVKKLDMPKDHHTGKQNKGHAFLHVKTKAEQDKLLAMNQVRIRNTMCDVLPYKKNEKRIIEESRCGSTIDSGRISACGTNDGLRSRNEPVDEFINFEEEVNQLAVDWSETEEESSSRDSLEVQNETTSQEMDQCVNNTVPTIFVGNESLIYPEFYTKLGLTEADALANAEFANKFIVENQVTKEFYEQNFMQWFQHYTREIVQKEINQCMGLLMSMQQMNAAPVTTAAVMA